MKTILPHFSCSLRPIFFFCHVARAHACGIVLTRLAIFCLHVSAKQVRSGYDRLRLSATGCYFFLLLSSSVTWAARSIRLSVSARIRSKPVLSRCCDIEMVDPRCVELAINCSLLSKWVLRNLGLTPGCPNWMNRSHPPVHCPLARLTVIFLFWEMFQIKVLVAFSWALSAVHCCCCCIYSLLHLVIDLFLFAAAWRKWTRTRHPAKSTSMATNRRSRAWIRANRWSNTPHLSSNHATASYQMMITTMKVLYIHQVSTILTILTILTIITSTSQPALSNVMKDSVLFDHEMGMERKWIKVKYGLRAAHYGRLFL